VVHVLVPDRSYVVSIEDILDEVATVLRQHGARYLEGRVLLTVQKVAYSWNGSD